MAPSTLRSSRTSIGIGINIEGDRNDGTQALTVSKPSAARKDILSLFSDKNKNFICFPQVGRIHARNLQTGTECKWHSLTPLQKQLGFGEKGNTLDPQYLFELFEDTAEHREKGCGRPTETGCSRREVVIILQRLPFCNKYVTNIVSTVNAD